MCNGFCICGRIVGVARCFSSPYLCGKTTHMRYFIPLLLLALAACQAGPSPEEQAEQARQARRDSLIIVINTEIDSLQKQVAELNRTEAFMDSVWAGAPKNDPWYQDRKSRLAGMRAGLQDAIRAKEVEVAGLD